MDNKVAETIAALSDGRSGAGATRFPMSLDTRIFLGINDFARATPWLHPVVSAYAGVAAGVFAGLALTGVFAARHRGGIGTMAAALWVPVAMVLAVRVNQPLAAFLGKTRPYVSHAGILVLGNHAGPTFPSHRAAAAGAIVAGLLLVHRYLALAAAAAALALAFADVYTAAHYPQDELAGLILGAAVCLIGFDLTRHPLCWSLRLLGRTRFRRLITDTPGPDPASTGRPDGHEPRVFR
ncbi:phosphatase PAP2 family protein [Nocardia sp. NPDC020380]|uniref:phosphatase PAP2 family protein n=1 Tax=Nocardia sp. NPDC020380 TaxID=3364309 RepID=UPI0037B32436